MYPGHFLRFLFAFILFGASAVILVTVVKTAISDFNGSCLVNAEVYPNPTCDQECASGGTTCAGGEGTCMGGQCSVDCFNVSEGSSAQCWYIVAADALSLLLAMQLLLYAVISLAIGTPVGYASCILLVLTGLIMAAAMAAASALLTRGYVRLCNTLNDNGSDCEDDTSGYFIGNNLPYHYNSALQAALICGWIATLFWLLLALSSMIQMCLVRRRRWTDTEMGPTKYSSTTTTAYGGPASTFTHPGSMAAATGAGTGALAGALAAPATGSSYQHTASQYPVAAPVSAPYTSTAAGFNPRYTAAPVYPTPSAAAAAAAAPTTTTATTTVPLVTTNFYPPSSHLTSLAPAAGPATTGTAPFAGATRVYPPTTTTTTASNTTTTWSEKEKEAYSRPYPPAGSGGGY